MSDSNEVINEYCKTVSDDELIKTLYKKCRRFSGLLDQCKFQNEALRKQLIAANELLADKDLCIEKLNEELLVRSESCEGFII